MEPYLASPVDLASEPGMDFTLFTTDQVKRALARATSAIIAEIGWDPRESERTYTIRKLCSGTPIFLPARHVTEVAVNADGTDLTVEDDWWTDRGRLDIPRGVTRGTVTYTAGWFTGDGTDPSEVPDQLRDACLALAAESLTNQSRLKSWTVDDVTETYELAGDLDLSSELAQFSVWAIV